MQKVRIFRSWAHFLVIGVLALTASLPVTALAVESPGLDSLTARHVASLHPLGLIDLLTVSLQAFGVWPSPNPAVAPPPPPPPEPENRAGFDPNG